MKKAVLLDVSAIMYRAFFANPHFRTKNEPTGAVYGFTGTLLKILKEFEPDYMAAAFDVSRSTLKRTEIYKEYKAHRDAAPEDLISQISRIEEMLDAFGVKRFKINGHEADDVIGTIAKKLSLEGYQVYVVTGDKDLAQIIDKNIKIALMGKGENGKDTFKIIATDEDVIEYLGVPSHLVPDLFGLIGDSSDGIPGVRKIGVKKASPMIQTYGSLEKVYENLDKLTELSGIGKYLVQNMIEDKELAFLSKQLATIEQNIPEISFEVDELLYKVNTEKLRALFDVLEFKNLGKKFLEEQEGGAKSFSGEEGDDYNEDENLNQNSEQVKNLENNNTGKNIEQKNINTFHSKIKPLEKPCDLNLETIILQSEDDITKLFDEISKEIRTAKIFVYSNEVGLAFSTKDKNFYLPLSHKQDLFGTFANMNINSVQKIFEQDFKLVGYNLKNLFALGANLKTENILFDSLIGSHMITSSTKDDIEKFAKDYCDVSLKKYDELFKKISPEEVSVNDFAKYMCDRSRVIYESAPIILDILEQDNLLEVVNKIETPLIEVLFNMEKNGIKIDMDYFSKLSADFNLRLEETRKKIYNIAGKEFNINSPKQLGEILFLDLNLPIIKKGKTGPSTDVDVLEELDARGHEIAHLLLEHRHLSKLLQTYIEPLPKLVDQNFRLHSSFNQIGTTTGRLSSSNPNLQNIPVKSEEGIKIRKAFVVNAGNKLLGIDYSQIELRVLAEMTGDKNLVLAYQNDLDLHELTARKLFHVADGEKVSREQRIIAKTINFSVIYGKTAFGLAKELKISAKEAAHYIATYFEQYPAVKLYEKKVLAQAEQDGFVRTLFGRKRIIEDINSRNKNIKQQAERMAVNAVIQGTAAEIIKKAMINIFSQIKNSSDIKLILQVHDELMFEIAENSVTRYKNEIEKIMRYAVQFNLSKLEVNGEIGNNWAETK
ncbi:MAG: DNA polymerase I [Fusobacteriaceae bacterium]